MGLKTILATAALALSAHTAIAQEATQKLRQTTALVANYEKEYIDYTIKNFKDGLQDIMALSAQGVPLEMGYLYAPEDSTWYQATTAPQVVLIRSDSSLVGSVTQFHNKIYHLINAYKKFVLVHTHPPFIQESGKELARLLPPENIMWIDSVAELVNETTNTTYTLPMIYNYEMETTSNFHHLDSLPPSLIDLHGSTELLSQIEAYNNMHQNNPYIEKYEAYFVVATPKGLFRYAPTVQGVNKFRSTGRVIGEDGDTEEIVYEQYNIKAVDFGEYFLSYAKKEHIDSFLKYELKIK